MRTAEGAALDRDLRSRGQTILDLVAQVATSRPLVRVSGDVNGTEVSAGSRPAWLGVGQRSPCGGFED